MEEVPIGDDFERDGDCGEFTTFLGFSEGYLLTIDRIFNTMRKDLGLTEHFMNMPGLGRISGFKKLE